MKDIHVECKPDEALMKKLGFTKKRITHHQGKSRVFAKLLKSENHLAVVDEDPGSAKTKYEKGLKLNAESYGVKFYIDEYGNKIFILKGKLEDWIIQLCNESKVDIKKFGLPNIPNELHNVINQRIESFEKLIDHLLDIENNGIKQLKLWLQ